MKHDFNNFANHFHFTVIILYTEEITYHEICSNIPWVEQGQTNTAIFEANSIENDHELLGCRVLVSCVQRHWARGAAGMMGAPDVRPRDLSQDRPAERARDAHYKTDRWQVLDHLLECRLRLEEDGLQIWKCLHIVILLYSLVTKFTMHFKPHHSFILQRCFTHNLTLKEYFAFSTSAIFSGKRKGCSHSPRKTHTHKQGADRQFTCPEGIGWT